MGIGLSVIYAVAAAIALLLLAGYGFFVREKNAWFTFLFACVSVVNLGYALLAFSVNLEMALMANRLAYFGSVFLPLPMLVIILKESNVSYPKMLPKILMGLSVLIFLIAASPGILDIYYKEVSFAVVNGTSTLVKTYGVLHPIYLVYLVGYFAAMVGTIVRGIIKKTMNSVAQPVVLSIAVFVNIGIWFIEQITSLEFEFLSVSYIISELFLLGLYLATTENRRLQALIRQKEEELTARVNNADGGEPSAWSEEMEYFLLGRDTLTPTERIIYQAYIDGNTTKEVLEKLGITENTLKFHNKNIYSKLGVSSRKQLREMHRAVSRAK